MTTSTTTLEAQRAKLTEVEIEFRHLQNKLHEHEKAISKLKKDLADIKRTFFVSTGIEPESFNDLFKKES